MPNKILRFKRQEKKPAFIKQHCREVAEYYTITIIDERYGAGWYDIPIKERQEIKIEIRKEAKRRCQ